MGLCPITLWTWGGQTSLKIGQAIVKSREIKIRSKNIFGLKNKKELVRGIRTHYRTRISYYQILSTTQKEVVKGVELMYFLC